MILLEVAEEEDAVPTLAAAIGSQRLVRVDGHSGVGKSRVAKALAAALGWKRLATDDFLDHPQNGRKYVDQVLIGHLHEAIDLQLQSVSGVVLDGICLDHLVTPARFCNEMRVYVETLTDPGWHEDEESRNQELGTDVYHQAIGPRGSADFVVSKRVHGY